MRRHFLVALTSVLILLPIRSAAQGLPLLTDEIAARLSELPLGCIEQEYPNKTAHIINNETEAKLTPRELHPAFFGCFDWHSSVHGHWMLVRLLKIRASIPDRGAIVDALNRSFTKSNLSSEAEYFAKYETANIFERTYGWAWLLKLDEELMGWDDPLARQWHENLQPLTQYIVATWKAYLPKQTYPNRTGVHANSAFAMGFAIDWARAAGDKETVHRNIGTSAPQRLARCFCRQLRRRALAGLLCPDGTGIIFSLFHQFFRAGGCRIEKELLLLHLEFGNELHFLRAGSVSCFKIMRTEKKTLRTIIYVGEIAQLVRAHDS